MIETKDITKMVKHIIRRDKGIYDPQIMHPLREWITGLSLVFFTVLVGALYCFYLYHYYQSELNIEIVSDNVRVPYQAAVVKNALKFYGNEKTNYENILGGSSGVVTIPPTSVISTSTATNSIQPVVATTTKAKATSSIPSKISSVF